MKIDQVKKMWRGGLIVSCQAAKGEPMHGLAHIGAFARAAETGGAAGVRIDAPENVRAVRAITKLPIVASYKIHTPGSEVYVTPTFEAAREVARAGADVIGMDATRRERPGKEELAGIIERIHEELGAGVMADVSTLEEAVEAQYAGADFVTTALAGFTAHTKGIRWFDFDLLAAMVRDLDAPVVAEGRIETPEQAGKAIEAGAFAVVVGTAITRPEKITERFVTAMRGSEMHHAKDAKRRK
ncbi:MAG: N-acetylmannosamine-6-phosphate 2-epimerase [Planctomycetota bacterium]